MLSSKICFCSVEMFVVNRLLAVDFLTPIRRLTIIIHNKVLIQVAAAAVLMSMVVSVFTSPLSRLLLRQSRNIRHLLPCQYEIYTVLVPGSVVFSGVDARVEPGNLTQLKRITFVICPFIVHPDTGVSYTKQYLAQLLHRHCNDDVCARDAKV